MSLKPFPLLADPRTYRPCVWDLTHDRARREYWLGLFRGHLPKMLEEAAREAAARGEDGDAHRRAAVVRDHFNGYLDRITAEPGCDGPLDILAICRARERAFRAAGIDDPYRLAKHRENEVALDLLPDVLVELDAMPDARRERVVIEGVFAGNIFDMGAVQTEAMFKEGRVDFHHTRQRLKARPWLIDGMDDWLARRTHRCAVLFVDNAGPDIVLGMVPFARHLLLGGTRVILAANDAPSLNDVTIDELTRLLERIARRDPIVAAARDDGRLRLLGSGNDAPLIDLSRVAAGLCAAVEAEPGGVDLVVLEGMGRAIETNLDARFSCDVLKIAMIKDQGVAEALGGELFDLVLKYEPAG